MPWKTALLGEAFEGINGNLDPISSEEFGTICLYVFENLPTGSLPNRIQVRALSQPCATTERTAAALWDGCVSLGTNLLLIMLYSYTERNRGCSTELYFCIAWKTPWPPLLIRGVIIKLSCSKKAESRWWNSRVLVHLYAWTSLFLERVNRQIMSHISLDTGHGTKCSAPGILVCLCPYVCFFRPLDHNNVNPKDFSDLF